MVSKATVPFSRYSTNIYALPILLPGPAANGHVVRCTETHISILIDVGGNIALR